MNNLNFIFFRTLAVLFLIITCFQPLVAATKTFTGPGNFSDAGKWNLSALPAAGDNLQINGVCIYDNAAANLVYGNLNIGATVSGSVFFPVGAVNTLDVLNVSSSTAGSSLNMSNGGILMINGSWTSTNCAFTPGTGTIEMQDAITLPAAYPTFYNLIINTAGNVSLGVTTSINNNLSVTMGTFTIGAFGLSVANLVTVDGTMNLTSTTGTKTIGALLLNGGTLMATANETLTVTTSMVSTGNSSIGALTLVVNGSATVVSGTLNFSSTTGTKTFGSLIINGIVTNTANESITINGDMVDNGTFSIGTGVVTFTGAASNTVSGSAAFTSFSGGITVNKGSTGTVADTANVLDVQSVITMINGGLTLTRGTFKVSSASVIVPFVSTGTPSIVPAPAKLWCNGATFNSTASFDWGVSGIIQLDNGTINFGTMIDDRVAPEASGTCIIRINGGAFNVAGRISNGTNGWKYAMTAGVLTVGIVGNSSPADKDPFNMDNPICSFSMTGGRIIIERAGGSGATPNLGYHNVGTVGAGFVGGTLQIGDANTPAGNHMHIETDISIYNLEVVNANTTAQFWTYNTVITNNVTITAGVLDQGTNARDISVGGNWTNNSSAAALVTGTRKVTFNGTLPQLAGGTYSTTFYDAVINNTNPVLTAATITLAKPEYVSHALAMTRGYVNTDAVNILWMLNNSTTTTGSANSFVNGPMNYDMAVSGVSRTLLFPIGKGADWRYAMLTANNSAAATITFNAEVFNASASALGWTLPPTVDTVSNVHYWDIKRYTSYPSTESSASVNGNQTVQLHFEANDEVIDGAFLTVCKNVNGGTAWTDIGGTGAPAYAGGAYLAGAVTSTAAPAAFTSFSRFTLGSLLSGWNPLPIELLSFTALPCNKNVCLNWTTATETNNDYFTIEKTTDMIHYQWVAKVNGAGNTVVMNSYTASDHSPYNGVSYYRLKQTDYNGSVTYSDIRQVNFDAALSADFTFSMYPNPGNGDNVSITMQAAKGSQVIVNVYDVNGKLVYETSIISAESGQNVFTLSPAGKLSKGLYMINAVSGGNRCSQKLLVE